MSVMACDRVCCDNILCHQWSRAFGYICSDCFEELVESGIYIDIDLFMSANYRKPPPPKVRDPREYFEGIFGRSEDERANET